MMKKLFLLAATALVGFNANAQLAETLQLSGGFVKEAAQPKVIDNPAPSAKSSIAGGRWYHHGALINSDVLPGQMEMHLLPIWFDSTVKQRFSDGSGGTLLSTVNYSSLGQVVDPFHFTLWNDVNVPSNDPNEIGITENDDYQIDSISFGAYYVEVPARPEDVVDTFIFSVSTSGNDIATPVQTRNPSSENWVNNYTCPDCADSTLKAFRILPSDSVNRASGVNGVTMWKVPIDTSFRRADSAGYIFFRSYTYPVPGPVTIPAGRTAGVTITFKSGDNVIPGDSLTGYHHIFMRSGEGTGLNQTAGQKMPYFYYEYNDENSSNLMFSTAPDFYAATIIIEGHNQLSFRNEFHDIATHITCSDCQTVAEISSVHNVNSTVATDMIAYPNPVDNEVNVSFYMNQNTSATVSISNAVGQVIATQKVDNVKAKERNIVTFSTADLSSGIYFYTVEAKGQRTTNRFVVTH